MGMSVVLLQRGGVGALELQGHGKSGPHTEGLFSCSLLLIGSLWPVIFYRHSYRRNGSRFSSCPNLAEWSMSAGMTSVPRSQLSAGSIFPAAQGPASTSLLGSVTTIRGAETGQLVGPMVRKSMTYKNAVSTEAPR